MNVPEINRTIEALWRMESARILGSLVRHLGDLGLAEEVAQDTLVTALETWPRTGIPDRPGAWLTAVAKNRARDVLRRSDRTALLPGYPDQIPLPQGEAPPGDMDTLADRDFTDGRLPLMFISCHPVLSPEARVALTLRLLGGLTVEEIARAYLVSPTTIAQRIVRAKRTLSAARLAFEMPSGPERVASLSSILQVLYLIFNEGYAATSGPDWMRPALCEEALRLGRILAGHVPEEPEVLGLLALMEIQASRIRARVTHSGEPIPLAEQNRAHWDFLLIDRGLASLARAEKLASPPGPTPGPYMIQAAIAACHARARSVERTDFARIAALYQQLYERTSSPVVLLNLAVAIGMAEGPAEGLRYVDRLASDPVLSEYHLLPGVRGDLLARLGRHREAAEAFDRAAVLARNQREAGVLQRRAEACRLLTRHPENG